MGDAEPDPAWCLRPVQPRSMGILDHAVGESEVQLRARYEAEQVAGSNRPPPRALLVLRPDGLPERASRRAHTCRGARRIGHADGGGEIGGKDHGL